MSAARARPSALARAARNWTWITPLLAVVVLALTWGRTLPTVILALVAIVLAVAVLSSVHHAEVIAHKVGEPMGSLVLAVAVTVIEVGLIVALMLDSASETSTLARDTVFAAVMITCNGIAGLCFLLGSLRYGVALFNAEGSGAALATVTTLSALSLVLPTFTTSEPGPVFSPAQLAFAACASLALYGLFVITQTVRHRDFFLPVFEDEAPEDSAHDDAADDDAAHDDADGHAPPPSGRAALISLGLLFCGLLSVVGLAKVESHAIESAVKSLGFPVSFVGVVIALLVLMPETLAAARAAQRNHMQISLNLAYGSAMASIGLTIPAIALASIWLDGPLVLGLGPTQIALLVLTVVVAALTVVPGRATRLQGGVHLVVFAAFVFLAINP